MFDPYHKWLGIAPKDQPPNHYRLLAIEAFESDPEVIDAAANRQMGYLQQRATGEHAALSQKLLNEVAGARVCLLNAHKKTEYDAELRRQLAKADQPAGKPSPDLTGVKPDGISYVPPAPLRPSRARRSFRPEPWHYAVAIGFAGLLGIGGWAVFYSGRTSGQQVAVAESEQQDVPQGKGKTTAAPPHQASQERPSENEGSTHPRVAKQKSSGPSARVPERKPSTWMPPVYRLTIEPSWANLDLKYDKVTVSGSGRERQVRVDEPPGNGYVQLIVSCAGYESNEAWLTPKSGKDQDISISLKESKNEVRAAEGVVKIDLLALVNPEKHTITGAWRFDGTTLIGERQKEGPSVVLVPYHPSGEYELQITARNPGGGSALVVGFAYEGKQPAAFLSVDDKSWIKGLNDEYNNRTSVKFFEGDTPAHITCTVKKDRVLVKNDAGATLEWQGDYGEFVERPFFWTDIPDKQALFLGVWGEFEISEMKLTLLRTNE